MTGLAWSQDATADVITALQAIVDANLSTLDPTIYPGPADQGAQPPFIVAWMLDPQWTGAGLGQECWGLAHQQWQVGAHGSTQMEARHMLEQLTAAADWPDGWELVEIGPLVEDRADTPTTWWYPVTVVYRGMT